MLDAIELETGENPSATIIWLHGLGADGHDFAPIVPELKLDSPVRFIFPHAPMQPVTINGGMVMRAWYDISDTALRREDEQGVRASEARLREFIDREVARGIDSGRIVLAGFSQGGAIALHTGLRFPHALAGIMALSTYVPLPDRVAAERATGHDDLPIFMAHGSEDSIIVMPRAQQSCRTLEALGYRVEWHDYRMAHAVCAEEIDDIGRWLRRVLS